MTAFAIKLIPNVEHTERVLNTRRALRLVPPGEGVWPASVDTRPEGRDALAARALPSGAVPSEETGDAQTPHQES